MNVYRTSLFSGLLMLSLAAPVPAAQGDDPLLGKFMLDKFETSDADGDAPLTWELDAWLGKDLNKVWIKSSGERLDGETEQSNELLYSRAVSPFWDAQVGLRRDSAGDSDRNFFSVGLQGLAPYLFDTSTSVLFGDDGQVGLAAQFEYELMLTQRWVLSPEIELDFWAKEDPEMNIGSGLSTAELGLRLRYEVRREFAPYIGISWSKAFGDTAEYASAEGEGAESTLFVAGARIWF